MKEMMSFLSGWFKNTSLNVFVLMILLLCTLT